MIPEKFGRYEVLGELGDGAMGRVYRAFDPIVRRSVAVKTIKSEFLTKDEAPEYLRRFRREAQAAGVLNHPNIVSIFDVGENYLVMELLEGKTLQAELLEKGKLEPAEALRILTPVAEGLDHAHRAGILHRDIKPANIMVLSDGRAKLMDFGVAHVETSVMTTAGQIFGSPSYMSPEQVSGNDVDSRSDLYSLAVVAYEALTGQRPFQGTSLTSIIYKVMSEVPAPPRQWNSALPERYDDVFERALAKDPKRRYATGSEFLAALDLKEFDIALSSAVEPAKAAAPRPKTRIVDHRDPGRRRGRGPAGPRRGGARSRGRQRSRIDSGSAPPERWPSGSWPSSSCVTLRTPPRTASAWRRRLRCPTALATPTPEPTVAPTPSPAATPIRGASRAPATAHRDPHPGTDPRTDP